MKIVILYSGGLDSFILYHYAKAQGYDDVTCVFFDIGQPYVAKELAALPDFVHVRRVDWLTSDKDLHSKDNTSGGNIYIPARNATLASLAASIYCPDQVWLGGLKGEDHDRATDKNAKFANLMTQALGYAVSPFVSDFSVRFPFVEASMGKLEIVQWALLHGLSVSDLHKTSSCLSGEAGNCGTCMVCVRRWGIFGQLGYPEKLNADPLSSKFAVDMLLDLLCDSSVYDDFRKSEVVPHLVNVFGSKATATKELVTIGNRLEYDHKGII